MLAGEGVDLLAEVKADRELLMIEGVEVEQEEGLDADGPREFQGLLRAVHTMRRAARAGANPRRRCAWGEREGRL